LTFRDSLEGSGKIQELVFDVQLNCYYDPKTNEYFELKA